MVPFWGPPCIAYCQLFTACRCVLAARHGELHINTSETVKSSVQCAAYVILRGSQNDVIHGRGRLLRYSNICRILAYSQKLLVTFPRIFPVYGHRSFLRVGLLKSTNCSFPDATSSYVSEIMSTSVSYTHLTLPTKRIV